MKTVTVILLAAISFVCTDMVQAQTTTLRYGQIPSTMKSVSALHFNIAQRKGLFVREGINVEMISIEAEKREISSLLCHLQSVSLICNTYAPRVSSKRKSIIP
jgi:ABC-type nitrate/sulfonate/bicarbonate transport system substrate-binding protein